MLAKIYQEALSDQIGFNLTLQHLTVTPDKLAFRAIAEADHTLSSDLSLLLSSGLNEWSFPCILADDFCIFEGDLGIENLSVDASFIFSIKDRKYVWLTLMLDPSLPNDVWKWSNFFSGAFHSLPNFDLGKVCRSILNSADVITPSSSANKFSSFLEFARSPDFVISLARLRHSSRFPSILGGIDGHVIASRLVSNWNLLLIQESQHRLLVFQGVTSCDAVFIPGLNILIILCHITHQQISQCLEILSRTPDFFEQSNPSVFTGYLVGHSRPYHCNYDSLIALQHILEEGELSSDDALFSKGDEAFLNLSAALGLPQEHQLRTRESLNELVQAQHGYLLQLGSLFYRAGHKPDSRSLLHASHLDASLRQYSTVSSTIATSGALALLEEFKPLIWIGVTGQKRCWLEQVNGVANILNTLHFYYPNLGVVFDGWTPPLVNSDYHRKESRKDSRVIDRIIKRLRFRNQGCFGVIAGLPMLEKIRIGLSVDFFITNYTSGSLNVARICQKPGVGHMSCRMMDAKDQHIHHKTREVDPIFVQDQMVPNTSAGYINYSLPWQAVYNKLIPILKDLPIEPSQPLELLTIPGHH